MFPKKKYFQLEFERKKYSHPLKLVEIWTPSHRETSSNPQKLSNKFQTLTYFPQEFYFIKLRYIKNIKHHQNRSAEEGTIASYALHLMFKEITRACTSTIKSWKTEQRKFAVSLYLQFNMNEKFLIICSNCSFVEKFEFYGW